MVSRELLPEGTSIIVGNDGSYHWVYEYNLFKNPAILITLAKIFAGVCLGITFFMIAIMVPDIMKGYSDLEDAAETIRFNLLMFALLLAVSAVGILLYAAMQGGKYCVLFSMDDKGVEHRQMPQQYDKARIVNAVNVVLGAATKNLTLAGMGLASTRDAIVSDFSAVTDIRAHRRLGTIRLNELASKNQVYAEPVDFDFVLSFICAHCPNAKVSPKNI